MRALLVLIAFAAATPALAQPSAAEEMLRAELAAQQLLDRQRQVALDNQLMSLEAQLRANQAEAVVRQQSTRPYLPLPPLPPEAGPAAPSPAIDTSKLVSIPDDRLAASNAAVREVTQGRR
jgi:hypothetical protein